MRQTCWIVVLIYRIWLEWIATGVVLRDIIYPFLLSTGSYFILNSCYSSFVTLVFLMNLDLFAILDLFILYLISDYLTLKYLLRRWAESTELVLIYLRNSTHNTCRECLISHLELDSSILCLACLVLLLLYSFHYNLYMITSPLNTYHAI